MGHRPRAARPTTRTGRGGDGWLMLSDGAGGWRRGPGRGAGGWPRPGAPGGVGGPWRDRVVQDGGRGAARARAPPATRRSRRWRSWRRRSPWGWPPMAAGSLWLVAGVGDSPPGWSTAGRSSPRHRRRQRGGELVGPGSSPGDEARTHPGATGSPGRPGRCRAPMWRDVALVPGGAGAGVRRHRCRTRPSGRSVPAAASAEAAARWLVEAAWPPSTDNVTAVVVAEDGRGDDRRTHRIPGRGPPASSGTTWCASGGAAPTTSGSATSWWAGAGRCPRRRPRSAGTAPAGSRSTCRAARAADRVRAGLRGGPAGARAPVGTRCATAGATASAPRPPLPRGVRDRRPPGPAGLARRRPRTARRRRAHRRLRHDRGAGLHAAGAQRDRAYYDDFARLPRPATLEPRSHDEAARRLGPVADSTRKAIERVNDKIAAAHDAPAIAIGRNVSGEIGRWLARSGVLDPEPGAPDSRATA